MLGVDCVGKIPTDRDIPLASVMFEGNRNDCILFTELWLESKALCIDIS